MHDALCFRLPLATSDFELRIAGKLADLGHTVKLMAPQFVKPYVKTNKNDAADVLRRKYPWGAAAICEAVRRPSMRFVPIKNGEQQAALALHRARQGFVKARTAQANQIRGLLAEYGLPGLCRDLLQRLGDHLKILDEQVAALEVQIQAWHRANDLSRKLAAIPGIGPITASALVASIGDAKHFTDGRQLAAWLGLVPRQHSSGGKPMLLGISKRGDTYLRTLLIHGARSVVRVAEAKANHAGSWLAGVMARRNKNVAAVALANKNARIVWALLAQERDYDADYGASA